MTTQHVLPFWDELESDGTQADSRTNRYPDGGSRPGGHVHLDLSSVRLMKVPDVAPPFDCEVLPAGVVPAARAGTTLVAGSGARAALPAQRPGSVTGTRPPARAGTERPAGCDDWAQQFARLLVETLAGARPLRQLMPWLTDRARVHLRRVAPILRCGQRPRVIRVLASMPTSSVVEMSVVVGLGSRTRALAVRLEEAVRAGHPTRWLCTDIEAA
jgi:uncharacterized protein DUF6459